MSISEKINTWIVVNYSSRKGLLLTNWYRLLFLLGRYRKYRQVDWSSVERLVFVCKGNICRSAYGEEIARSLGIETVSCGLDTVDGEQANEMARKVSAERGVNLSEHKTTRMQSLTLQKGDLLLAMELWQVEAMVNDPSIECKCTLLGLWGKPVLPHIHDPYGYSPLYFDTCFNFIEDAVNNIAIKLKDSR